MHPSRHSRLFFSPREEIAGLPQISVIVYYRPPERKTSCTKESNKRLSYARPMAPATSAAPKHRLCRRHQRSRSKQEPYRDPHERPGDQRKRPSILCCPSMEGLPHGRSPDYPHGRTGRKGCGSSTGFELLSSHLCPSRNA